MYSSGRKTQVSWCQVGNIFLLFSSSEYAEVRDWDNRISIICHLPSERSRGLSFHLMFTKVHRYFDNFMAFWICVMLCQKLGLYINLVNTLEVTFYIQSRWNFVYTVLFLWKCYKDWKRNYYDSCYLYCTNIWVYVIFSREQRVTGIAIFLMIGLSVFLTSLLKVNLPIASVFIHRDPFYHFTKEAVLCYFIKKLSVMADLSEYSYIYWKSSNTCNFFFFFTIFYKLIMNFV